jgi:FKBP-type peptidyl-prolyl cis-trans isomerase FklB
MKLHFLFACMAAFAVSACNRDRLESDRQQQSYAIGYKLGQQLAPVKNDIDPDVVARGLKDGIGGTSKLPPGVVATKIAALQQKQLQSDDRLAEENRKRSLEYMVKIAASSEAQVLADGIVFKVIKPGSGRVRVLKDDDEITLRFKSQLIDGTVVDESNQAAGVTIKFKSLVLPGLKRALQKMAIGAEWIVYLAPNQAYADAARPGVPRQSVLVCEITLVGVKPHNGVPSTK